MLETANGRKLAAAMPPDRVVPESDGPFAKVGGAPLLPWNVNTVTVKLAEIWGVQQAAALKGLRSNGLCLARLLTGGDLDLRRLAHGVSGER